MRRFSFIGRARAGERFSLHVGGWVDSCGWIHVGGFVCVEAREEVHTYKGRNKRAHTASCFAVSQLKIASRQI